METLMRLWRSELTSYVLAGAIVLGLGLLIYGWGRMDGAVRAERELSDFKLTLARETQLATEKVRQAEREASKSIRLEQERTDARIHQIDRRHRTALERLRQQNTSLGGVRLSDCSAAESADGARAGLAGGNGIVVDRLTDAELRFPIDFARDAAQIAAALDHCRAQYEIARILVNGG